MATERHHGRWPRLRGLGLRGRITVVFALVALIVSALLALVAWSLVSSYLLAQREQTTLRQAVSGARILQRSLGSTSTSVPELLDSLPASIGAESLLYYGDRWYASSLDADPRTIPAGLRDVVLAGGPARQRVRVGESPVLVVGVPLGAEGAGAYFAVFPLTELDRTYRALSATLGGAAAATTAIGAMAGALVSRRALRPLQGLTAAARSIAAGRLETRLPPHANDPELADLAAAFNETASALQRRVQADARFAGDVSHELRTPLTTMLNAVALLRTRHDVLPPAAQEAVDLLEEEMDRFRQLTTDLLEISRVEGDSSPAREPVRIGELVRRTVPTVAGTDVEVTQGAEQLIVTGDKRRLERVVANLVQNAELHGEGCVAVRVSEGDGSVLIDVDDAGPGVPVEMRERIFERFARVAGDRVAGTGLGLALAQRHVAVHGGAVRVEDRPGGGARFRVELPAVTE
ncbi:HAMP domain-containing sensor histidine kinase [Cryptosporangium japonicum]|uniref:histidine kinase n=1 Tax=Cryptosporangium japonicum TaxID=80872 RepID=A0ABP3D4N1_9ACTN